MARHSVTEFLHAFEDAGAIFFDIEHDLLVVLDEQGNINRVNPAFEQALGREQKSVLHCEMIRLVHEDDLAAFIHSFDTSTQPEPVRLLRRDQGDVLVKLIDFKFKKTDEGLRGYLVLRTIE